MFLLNRRICINQPFFQTFGRNTYLQSMILAINNLESKHHASEVRARRDNFI